MTTRIDDHLSAKLQACCLNFNRVLKGLFGPQYGLDGELSFALQFSAIDFDQRKALMQAGDLPPHIEAVRAAYEEGLTDEQFNDPHYAYRVLFVPKTANRKGQADAVMEFVKPGSEEAEKINRYVFKDVDRPKFRPGIIVEQMNAEGFPRFKIHHHTDLWKAMDAKIPAGGMAWKQRVTAGGGMNDGSMPSESIVKRTATNTHSLVATRRRQPQARRRPDMRELGFSGHNHRENTASPTSGRENGLQHPKSFPDVPA